MILHLNDDHHWSREAIAHWVAPSSSAQPTSDPGRAPGDPSAAS
jgi:hypothetical protein